MLQIWAIVVAFALTILLLIRIERKVNKMADTLKEIRDEVSSIKTVDGAIIALVQGMAAKLKDLGSKPTVDPADVTALATELHNEASSLAQAVTDNTGVLGSANPA